jgi:activator of 2-hydroxyglutaryl-CoA dehydratase
VSSNCAVFAESEVITQANEGRDPADILMGVLAAVASRASSVLDRMGARQPVALCGGMARIPAFVQAFQDMAGTKFLTFPVDPRLVPAFGAALMAGEGRA